MAVFEFFGNSYYNVNGKWLDSDSVPVDKDTAHSLSVMYPQHLISRMNTPAKTSPVRSGVKTRNVVSVGTSHRKARVQIPEPVVKLTDEQQRCMEMLENDCTGEVSTILSERVRVASALKEIPAVRRVYDSDANFILARFDNPGAVYEYLVKNGIIVRNRNSVPGCEGCLRLTIGTPSENDRMLELLRKL